MKAIVTKCGQAADSPAAFTLQDLPMPEAEGRDILVKIAAVGMNPVDGKVRERFDGERVLGWDGVGAVETVGDDVVTFAPGDRVFYAGDITRPGTNAEYGLVDERIAAKAPTSLPDADAAAMPLTSITAWETLFDRLQFTPEAGANVGGSVLIVGGAGGVGSMATQLARWAGLAVIATASRPETVDWCKRLGAAHVLDHRKELVQELNANGFDDVDAVFCTTHLESHWNAIAECVRPQGRVAFIDDPTAPLDLTVFKQKSVSLHWEFMYTRSMFQTDDMSKQGELLARVAELLDEGAMVSTRSETLTGLTVENIRAMHLKQESGAMMGKQTLTVV